MELLKCTGCEVNYMKFIHDFWDNNEEALSFFREHGVLPVAVDCPKCHLPCTFRKGRGSWYCGRYVTHKKKKRRQCTYTVTDYKGTFLSQLKVEPWKLILFINHWLHVNWEHQTCVKSLKISMCTSINLRVACSEVAEFWLGNQDPIGGPGVVVEIDETLLLRGNNEQDKLMKKVWFFGGIERVSKRVFVLPLIGPEGEDRSAEVLIPLIMKYIHPQSIIITDGWDAYKGLSDLGYVHKVVNQGEKFVDSQEIHTQTIKRLWGGVKECLQKPGMRTKYIKQYLARFLFLYHFKDDAFHNFLIQVSLMFPPLTSNQINKQKVIIPLQEEGEVWKEEGNHDFSDQSPVATLDDALNTSILDKFKVSSPLKFNITSFDSAHKRRLVVSTP